MVHFLENVKKQFFVCGVDKYFWHPKNRLGIKTFSLNPVNATCKKCIKIIKKKK